MGCGTIDIKDLAVDEQLSCSSRILVFQTDENGELKTNEDGTLATPVYGNLGQLIQNCQNRSTLTEEDGTYTFSNGRDEDVTFQFIDTNATLTDNEDGTYTFVSKNGSVTIKDNSLSAKDQTLQSARVINLNGQPLSFQGVQNSGCQNDFNALGLNSENQLIKTQIQHKRNKTIFVDIKFGNDAKGEVENPDCPYATLDRAITDNGGDVDYYVFGDNTISPILLTSLKNSKLICTGTLSTSYGFSDWGSEKINLYVKAKNINIHQVSIFHNSGTKLKNGSSITFEVEDTITFPDGRPYYNFLFVDEDEGDNSEITTITFKGKNLKVIGSHTNTGAIAARLKQKSIITLDFEYVYAESLTFHTEYQSNCRSIVKVGIVDFFPKNRNFMILGRNGTIDIDQMYIKAEIEGSVEPVTSTRPGVFRSSNDSRIQVTIKRLFANNKTTTLTPLFGGFYKSHFDIDIKHAVLKGYSLYAIRGFSPPISIKGRYYFYNGDNVNVPSIFSPNASASLNVEISNAKIWHENSNAKIAVDNQNNTLPTNIQFRILSGMFTNIVSDIPNNQILIGDITTSTEIKPLSLEETQFENWQIN